LKLCARLADNGGMRLRRISFLFLIALALAAAGKPEPGGAGMVREITDGDTLVVEITEATAAMPPEAAVGTEIAVRLVGIQAPKLPLGRAGFEAWPLADESKAALDKLASGQKLSLAFGGEKMDRHGRLLAQLRRADGVWIQGEMLKSGMARVYTFADNRMLAAEMYALEREARAAKRGIWGNSFYAIRTPEEAGKFLGTFQLVEGTVVNAAKVHSRSYLNFGPDWKTDFTVTIPPAAQKMFRDADVDTAALAGKRIRVRGWIDSYNGPMIEATHPEQIEVLDR
jgi:endonuclease YncB( thermonuclease family)